MAATRKKSRKTEATKKARGYRPRKPPPKNREKAAEVVARLEAAYPSAECALFHRNAYELLVATILSAQCTDERVNLVTPGFFELWPTPAALARADRNEVESVVHSTGFFRNKAKNLQEMAARVVAAYDGEVPQDMDALLSLAGVARKTANVVRGVVWGLADGVVVDTHVARISRLLGWTRSKSADHIERDLMVLHPPDAWIPLSHLLIHHGRAVCKARRPDCAVCPVNELCPSAKMSS